MRIGIDARFFGPQESGLGRYVERLITHIARLDTSNEYVVFLRSSGWDHWEPPNSRWSKVRADFRWYTFDEQRRFPEVIRAAKVDLMHFPHFNVPVRYQDPFVVTIHDLTLHRYPTARASTLGPLFYWIKYLAYRFVITRAVKKAQAIICVSEYTKQDIIRQFKIPQDRLQVTYEAVDPLPPAVDWSALAKRGIRKPYLLYVGNSYPHKNLEHLVRAWHTGRADHEAQLVLVGKRDYFSRRLEQFAQQQTVQNVYWFGFANDSELSALYENAQAYFFPSLYEGFGLPGLEAMQAGIPVYAARASCLPEIYGPAAEYFDPNSVSDIRQSIDRALHDTLERSRLIAAGKERITRFSWSDMARQTLEVYESTGGKSNTTQRR